MTDKIKLREFLLKYTKTCDICYITECGYNLAMCYIDSEDLFIRGMSERVLNKKVIKYNYTKLMNHIVLNIEVSNE